ncbi:MAG: preprotein translocase subunit SecE [Candidatus Omnitrophica bacterium]|nr:preprotein translocase subunit SecE [Candidatus Omnitrophota bacterium]
MIKKLKLFFDETKQELKKTSWSSKDELIGSTVVVIMAVIALAVFIGVIDFVLSRLINIFIK